MKAWTDYPFIRLGDLENKKAPIREIEVVSYDGISIVILLLME